MALPTEWLSTLSTELALPEVVVVTDVRWWIPLELLLWMLFWTTTVVVEVVLLLLSSTVATSPFRGVPGVVVVVVTSAVWPDDPPIMMFLPMSCIPVLDGSVTEGVTVTAGDPSSDQPAILLSFTPLGLSFIWSSGWMVSGASIPLHTSDGPLQ